MRKQSFILFRPDSERRLRWLLGFALESSELRTPAERRTVYKQMGAYLDGLYIRCAGQKGDGSRVRELGDPRTSEDLPMEGKDKQKSFEDKLELHPHGRASDRKAVPQCSQRFTSSHRGDRVATHPGEIPGARADVSGAMGGGGCAGGDHVSSAGGSQEGRHARAAMSRDGLWAGVCAALPPGILLDGLSPPHQLSHLVSADEKSEEGNRHVAACQEAETVYASEASAHHGEPNASRKVRIRRGPRPEQRACLDTPLPFRQHPLSSHG